MLTELNQKYTNNTNKLIATRLNEQVNVNVEIVVVLKRTDV